jgi:hypothetical protein
MYFEIAEIAMSLWLLLAWGILVGFIFFAVGAAPGSPLYQVRESNIADNVSSAISGYEL